MKKKEQTVRRTFRLLKQLDERLNKERKAMAKVVGRCTLTDVIHLRLMHSYTFDEGGE